MSSHKLPASKAAAGASSSARVPAKGVPLAGVGDVVQGIKVIAECVREIQKEKTQQTKLKEEARVEVERIHAMRDVLLDYLDRSFDERRKNFESLFERLDKAIESDNPQLAGVVLDSVVKLADSSPFKALKDVASARQALGDKKTTWEF